MDIPPRNTTPVGSPTLYTHPASPSLSKSKQELAVKFILGKNYICIIWIPKNNNLQKLFYGLAFTALFAIE